MKRLLLSAAFAVATVGSVAAPAHATVITCDNLPVMVGCYHWGNGTVTHCDVWIAPHCIQIDDLIKTIA